LRIQEWGRRKIKKFSISYRDSNYDETSQKAEELLSESAYELILYDETNA